MSSLVLIIELLEISLNTLLLQNRVKIPVMS